MVSLYGWRTQEKDGLIVWVTNPGKRWSHCMGDEPRKNDGLIVWVTNPGKIMWKTASLWWVTYPNGKNVKYGLIIMGDLPRGRILGKLHAFLRNSFNTRSLLATFLDECRSTKSFLAISNNLESHRAIPFTKAKTWSSFWRPSSKNKIPSGDLLYPNNLESHLAIPFNQYVTRGPI